MVALRTGGGTVIPLDVARWRSEPDDVESALLASVEDPVLDIGCGPGRLTAALAAAGRPVLGIDPSPLARAEARRRGAPVLRRSVCDPLPGERRWATALLMDGNVGIGGDPASLLGRVAALIRPGGQAVVEVEAPGVPTESLTVRLHPGDGPAGPPFPWARVGADAVPALAAGAGLCVGAVDGDRGRWFARLVKP